VSNSSFQKTNNKTHKLNQVNWKTYGPYYQKEVWRGININKFIRWRLYLEDGT